MESIIKSAGLLAFREIDNNEYMILLCRSYGTKASHLKVWGIPKGRLNSNEDTFTAAKREFYEETGFPLSEGIPFLFLGTFMYPNKNKRVSCWAFKTDIETYNWKSNLMKIKKNGVSTLVPEIVEWKWFNVNEALHYIMKSQEPIVNSFINFINQN